jgi:hypothetical protein
MIIRFLREPLLHFAVMGLVLFGVYGLLNQEDTAPLDTRTIVVDRDALLTYVQYRTRAFEPDKASAFLDGLGDDELQQLIDDYVQEEALYREAIDLGLDRQDYVIRRRLIQGVEFLAQGLADSGYTIDEAQVREYFESHRDRYAVAAWVTFTHVFFDAEQHGAEGALELAKAKLAELNADVVQFSDAPRHGDRFPYHVNYVERGIDFVQSHFGTEMASAIFALDPDGVTWRGPFQSQYGAHLIMLNKRQDDRVPDLAEVIDRVTEDVRRTESQRRLDEAIDNLVGDYEVRLDLEPQDDAGTAAPATQ